MVILISLVTLGAGKFPCCKPDEGNRVSFGSASSHVLTENYSVIAFRVFAGDAIISLYGHVGHLPAGKRLLLIPRACGGVEPKRKRGCHLPPPKKSTAALNLDVSSSRPIREPIAFRSPLLLGVPLVGGERGKV